MPPPSSSPAPNPQFVQLIDHMNTEFTALRQRLSALEARQALADDGATPRMKIEFRSQFGEDLWIWETLRGQRSGFFIEVGAFDGYHYSVTYALEAIGWRGLLIEAIPEVCEKCRNRRPHSRVVHAALGRRGASGTADFVRVNDEYGGMLSFAHGAGGASGTAHAQKIAASKRTTSTVSVPRTSMNELLKGHEGSIDVAVIDVEGAELDVLDGFDLYAHKPRLLILEDNSQRDDSPLMQYMRSQPYVFAGWLAVNQLWVRADEQGLLNG